MKYLIKVIAIGFIIGIVIMFMNIGYVYYWTGHVDLGQPLFIIFGYFQLYSILITLANSLYFDYVNKKLGRLRKLNYRLIVSISGSIVLTTLVVLCLRAITWVLIGGNSVDSFFAEENIQIYFLSVTVTLIVSLLFHLLYYFKEAQKNIVTQHKVIAGSASAKFNALKNQLDPHFLFNSLNVLSSLIEENPEMAQNFTTSLSKVYRYVLEQKDKDLVSVDEEFQFARTYMSLMKMRFEDSLVFEIPDKSDNPESKVVPLSLQLLLENAIKHNIVISARPLKIKIYERDSELIVENVLQKKSNIKKSSGVGLRNIQERYGLLTSRKVNINQSIDLFEVALPMLTKQVTIMHVENESNLNTNYLKAKKRVEELKDFYYNILAYCLVIPFLIFVWNITNPNGFQWFWFPMFGWGLGLSFHAYKVFINDGMLGSAWEQRKLEQFMNEDR
ncbi:MAG: two-component system LytT family sensor kinase [Patiriisocius sp.]|jgi:two-component system LytT family sensor kinase